jgi:copper chaperone CopZ
MTTTLNIQNLKCHGCANTITKRLSELEDLSNVTVDTTNNAVSFDYNNDTTLEAATTLLSKLGYPVEGEHNPLTKKAKSFVSCAIGRMD